MARTTDMAIREDPAPRRASSADGPLATPVRRAAPPAHRPTGRERAATPNAAGSAATGPRAGGRPAPTRPDPRPMRLAVAAGGVAALSALLATIATSALPATTSVVTVQKDSPAEVAIVQQVTRVVKLPVGATAPPAAANVVVTALPAPVAKPRTVVVTTTQSGRVVKP